MRQVNNMKNVCQSKPLLSGVLLMILVFLPASGFSQYRKTEQIKKTAKQTVISQEQTSFSSEGEIKSRVEIPAAVLKQLSEYDNGRLAQCQQEADLRRSDAAEHFAASTISLNDDGRKDLLVQAQTGCFTGAHNTTFWLFARNNKKSADYELIFDIAVDFLKVLKTSAEKYRDIETASHTAVELYTINWEFDGRKYRKSRCRLTNENNRTSEIKCDF